MCVELLCLCVFAQNTLAPTTIWLLFYTLKSHCTLWLDIFSIQLNFVLVHGNSVWFFAFRKSLYMHVDESCIYGIGQIDKKEWRISWKFVPWSNGDKLHRMYNFSFGIPFPNFTRFKAWYRSINECIALSAGHKQKYTYNITRWIGKQIRSRRNARVISK